MPTFSSIEDDCLSIINKLKLILYERMDSVDSSTETVIESIDLLNQLGEPLETLRFKYIERVEKALDNDLNVLLLDIDMLTINAKQSAAPNSEQSSQKLTVSMDILEFVDHGCSNFLTNLSSITNSYNSIFVNTNRNFSKYHSLVHFKLTKIIK